MICKFSMGERSGGSGCDVTCFPVLAQIKSATHIALRVVFDVVHNYNKKLIRDCSICHNLDYKCLCEEV